MTKDVAVFGGGCFWCLEAVFERLEGVERVVSGYAGGAVDAPTYEAVCTGRTGHAEVIEVTFDPAVIPYRTLLEFFFAFHDPTTLNRQGPDEGTQYRSVVYATTPEQLRIAHEVVGALTAEGVFGRPIVTEITEAPRFWAAEAYHQQYYRRNPDRGYCAAMIAPKMAKLRKAYADRLKPESALLP